jgi:hypothetical protein
MSANSNVKPKAIFPVLGADTAGANGAPVSVAAAGTLKTGWVAVAGYHWLYLLVMIGVVDGTGAVTWQQATAAAGTNAKALEADEFNTTDGEMHITTGATDDGKVKMACGRTDRLDINGGFTHVQATLTVTGGTGSLFAMAVLGGPAPYQS